MGTNCLPRLCCDIITWNELLAIINLANEIDSVSLWDKQSNETIFHLFKGFQQKNISQKKTDFQQFRHPAALWIKRDTRGTYARWRLNDAETLHVTTAAISFFKTANLISKPQWPFCHILLGYYKSNTGCWKKTICDFPERLKKESPNAGGLSQVLVVMMEQLWHSRIKFPNVVETNQWLSC